MMKSKKLASKILLAVLLAAPYTAFAAEIVATDEDETINRPEETITINSEQLIKVETNNPGNRYAAVASNGSDVIVTAGKVIATNSDDTGVTALYGLDAIQGDITINADTEVVTTAAAAGTQSRSVRSNGGDILINGNLTVGTSSLAGATRGMEAWYGGNIYVNAPDKIELNVYSGNGYTAGIQNFSAGGTISLNAKDISINLTNSEDFDVSGGTYFMGLTSNKSTTEFNGNTTINLINSSSKGDACLLFIQCDAGDQYKTVINFNGENTVLMADSQNYCDGITVSGAPGEVNFNGTSVEISSKANNYAIGLLSQYGGDINSAELSNLKVTAVSENDSAIGIAMETYGVKDDADVEAPLYNYNGNVTLKGTTEITANGAGDSYGVMNNAYDNDNNKLYGKLYLGDNTKIAVTSSEGSAYGIYSDGNNTENTLVGDEISISAQGVDEEHGYALAAVNSAELNIGEEGSTVELIGIVDAESNAAITLAGNQTESSSGSYNAEGGGAITYSSGNWTINEWTGTDGNMTIAEAATVNINDTVEVNNAEVNGAVVVDNSQFENRENVITATKATIGEKASFLITNADTGNLVSLFSNDEYNKNVLNAGKVSTDNLMQIITYDEETGDILITVADAATALPGTIIPAIVTNLTNKNISNAFFDEMLKSGDAAKATAAINSIANMGELAGVNHGTYSMSNTMTDAVAHHLSLATHGEQDKDIWAHYIHNKEDVDGMTLGGVDANYDAQFNGIVIGSDLYKNGKTTAGIALSYADGNINGYNGIARSKNDAEYYGATLYGRIENENSAVLGDITYMHSDNDVTQTNSGHEITASADADAFSIGVRAEQAIKAGAGKFVPYAGLRYMHLGAGNYTNSLGMEYNADDQNLWLLPVGVTYSAEIASGDWTLKPIAEVGYVWTMGDRETDQTVYLNGAADSFGFETADSGSFISRFGLEAQNGSMTYGLGYEYQKGDSVKANRWLVNMVYSF